MMKIKLLLGTLLMMLSSICFGQVIINQNFNASTSLPSGWSSAGSFVTSTSSCAGNSVRKNVYSSVPTMELTSPNQVGASNGNDIAVSVDYKVVNWSNETVATPATFGSIVLQYSTNNGSSWTTIATRNAGNHVVANTCATITATVPAAAVPTGSDFRVRTLTTWAAGDYYMYNDNFIATQGGACILPTGITSSNITTTTANFSWLDAASATSGYSWEVVPAGNAQGVGVVASGTTAANAVATMATGLSSSTAYSFRIQSNCGGGNLSTWSTAVNFTTTAACGDTVYDTGGPSANYANNENYTITYFPDAPGNVVTLNFTQVALENCCDVLRVYNGIDTAAAPFTLDLENPASFRATNPAGAITLRFTSDFSSVGAGWTANYTCAPPPNCLEPTVLTASNFTTTSANLSWTSGGSGEMAWQVSYGTGTFLPSAGTIVTAGSNPFNLTGLIGGTTYQYYVRANCTGGDNSAWAGPFSFRIPALGEACTAPVVMPLEASCSTATPFTLDFATAADLGGAFTCDTTTSNFGKWFEFTASSTSAFSMNVSLAGLEYALFSTCGTELLCGALSNTAPNLIFGLTAGTTYRVAIWRDGASTLSSTVCFQEGPSCLNPDTLTATAITASTAQLGWRDLNAINTTASASFEVEYGVGTFAQGSGTTVVSPVGNPTTITGLTANTTYNYYVRANCGTGGFSTWSGPFSFTTQVGPHSFPLSEDFESDFSFFANASGNSTNFAISTAYFHTGTKSAANAHTSNNTNNLVETGILDLSSTNNPELSFWHIAKTEGTWDKCFIQISINGGNTYIDLPASAYQGSATDYGTRGYFHEDSYAIWGTTGSTPDNGTWWQQETFSLAAYKVPNVRLRFRLTSDGSTNRAGWFLDDIEIKEAPVDYIWDGMAWNITPEGAITANDNMTVQAGGMASLTGAVMVGNLTLEMGAALEADNGNIMVAQNVVNNGSITGSGQVVLNAGDATVTGTGSITNLTVGATGVAVINGMQTISQQLDVISGGSLNANGNITLSSNAMGTARVDAVDAGAITGNVNVERFIPLGNRAFRFIGSTVAGESIFDSWQESGNNAAGFGVQVTGTAGTVGTVNATTGHDETSSGANSLFKWNAASQTWAAVTNTRTEILTTGQYYRLFVRGDRMTDLTTNASATTATTLRATGTLLTGPMTVTPSITTGEFFALANPYQSKVNMSMATTTGTTAFMYYWDPNLGANGSYSAINITTGVGTAGAATNVLDAGQAVFFEDATAASTVTISESSKVAGNTNGGVFSTPASQQALRLKLYQTSRLNNGLSECDGLYLDFDATHNLGLDINDATKLYGANANIAIVKPTGQLLSVESRTLPTVNESIVLSTTNYAANAYTYVATLDILPGIVVFLKDNFTGTVTPLAQGTSTAVDFTVDMNNAASIDGSRFELIFNTTTLSNNNVAFGANLSVYPNPVKGDAITVNFGDSTVSNASVLIYNTLGQQVLSSTYNNISGGMIQVGNISGLTNGVYLMNISSNGSTITRRFIKE